MKPEPLDLKKLALEIAKLSAYIDEYGEWWGMDTNLGEDLPIDIQMLLKQHIKSACEFYLKYKDNPDLLIEEHPEYEDEILEMETKRVNGIVIVDFYDIYDEWLLRLAFKDVLKGDKG